MPKDTPKESKEFSKLTNLVTDLIRSNPQRSATALLGHILSRESDDMAANAVNHFCITLASQITHHPTEEPSAAPATTMLMCAQALKDIVEWAELNPADAAALEAAMSGFLAQHQLREDDFNERTPAANFHAVHTARGHAATLGLNMNGPFPNSADALIILARQAAIGEAQQLAQAEEGTGLYFHDTHYDHFQTRLWAETMLRASRALITPETW